MVHSAEVRQREIVRHKNQILPLWSAFLFQAKQMAEDTLADIAHIGCSVTQMLAACPLQRLDIALRDFLQSGICGIAILDLCFNLFDKRRIFQHHAMHIKNRPVDLWQALLDALFERINFLNRSRQSGVQALAFCVWIFSTMLFNRVKTNNWVDKVSLPGADSRRSTDSGQTYTARPPRPLCLLCPPALIGARALNGRQHACPIILTLSFLCFE